MERRLNDGIVAPVWQTQKRDALQGEPETKAYAAALSRNHLTVLIFERCSNGQEEYQMPLSIEMRIRLNEVMGRRQMTRQEVMSNLFSDIDNYGWWDSGGDAGPMQDKDVITSILGTRF